MSGVAADPERSIVDFDPADPRTLYAALRRRALPTAKRIASGAPHR